jgi:hypothetical protein
MPLLARRHRDSLHLVEGSDCNSKTVGELAFETSESAAMYDRVCESKKYSKAARFARNQLIGKLLRDRASTQLYGPIIVEIAWRSLSITASALLARDHPISAAFDLVIPSMCRVHHLCAEQIEIPASHDGTQGKLVNPHDVFRFQITK